MEQIWSTLMCASETDDQKQSEYMLKALKCGCGEKLLKLAGSKLLHIYNHFPTSR